MANVTKNLENLHVMEGSGKCGKAPAPAGNIVSADNGTFSELADV